MSNGSLTERKEVAYRYLIDAAKSLSSAADEGELVDRILDSSRDVMQCRACSVCLPDAATGDLIIRGTQPELKSQVLRVPAGKGIAGRVFRTRRPENARNVQSDSDHYAGIGQQTQTPAFAMLTIPVEEAGVCYGVMQALNPLQRDGFDDFDLEVFLAFAALVAATLARMEAQRAATRQEIDDAYRQAELSIARRAQISFMPPPSFVSGELSISVFQEQAAELGGDFYTYRDLADGSFLVAVGDASGKGIPAALETARVCTLISLQAPECSFARFSEWIARLNNVLWETAEQASSLTTLALLIVDPARRRLCACCFGQARPLYSSLQAGWQELPCALHPPLGVSKVDAFTVTTTPLRLARAWLLLTDGFVEARSSDHTQFGEIALRHSLAQAGPEPGALLHRLENDWRAFCQGGPERDDATALVLALPTTFPEATLNLTLEPETMAEGRHFFQRWVDLAGLSDRDSYTLVLACDEVLTNLYKHAYAGQPGPVRCEASLESHRLSFCLRHQGRGLTQEEYFARRQAAPDLTRPGGYGLPFLGQVFDEVHFERVGEEDAVLLAKNLVLPCT